MFYEMKIDFAPDEVLDYLRKSQSDDPLMTVEEVLSKHEAILDEWAVRNLGAKVPEENKYREVVSGETLSGRPEIQKLLRRIESPKIKAVKVVEPQRLTRGDLEDMGRLMKLLKHTHTLIITPYRIYNLKDEYDWDAFERELKKGNDYLEYYKKIQSRGKLLSVSQGNFIASTPPYGYDKTWVMDGKRKCPTLTENENAYVVRMIFDMYVNKGMGMANIGHALENMGIRPLKVAHWSPNVIKGILENPHYIGKVRWNWRKTQTIVEDSEIIKTRPKAKEGDYLIYDGKHQGIVSEELFYAAQKRMGSVPRVKPSTKLRNPFAGLLYCKCGYSMILRLSNKNGVQVAPPRLLCRHQVHCHTGSCIFDEFFEKVCDVLEQCIEDFKIELANSDNGDDLKNHATLIKNLEKKMKDLEAQELSQWQQQSHPDESQRMPAHIFKQLNERVLKEKDELQTALKTAYESMPEPTNYEEKVARFSDALAALRDPDVDAQKKNTLLKACIERIEYTREPHGRKEKKKAKADGSILPENHVAYNSWQSPPFEIDVILKV